MEDNEDLELPDSYRQRGRKKVEEWWERDDDGIRTILMLSSTPHVAFLEVRSHAIASLTTSQIFRLTASDLDHLIARATAVRKQMGD